MVIAVRTRFGSKLEQADRRTNSLAGNLRVLIDNLPLNGVTLAEIRDLIGQEGLLILTAFLALFFMFPVSMPGVSTVFGVAILQIGICRLLDRNLWLPVRIAQHMLPADKLRTKLNQGIIWLHRLESVSRPHRLKGLSSTALMEILNNCGMITGAVLLMAPFGLIPFTNTLPALALLFLAIGMLQQDGLYILFGHLANVATIAYFIILIVGGSAFIGEVLQYIAGKLS